MPDSSGETVRWIVTIDGMDVSDVDVRESEHGDVRTLVLVAGAEEIELHRWNPTVRNAAIREPGRIVTTLGELKRRGENG